MPWDVSTVKTEEDYTFNRAIPKTSKTWVRIDKVRAGANALMEGVLSDATFEYRDGSVHQRSTVHWELIKFNACWLTLIECNMEKDGKLLFPKRSGVMHREVSKERFADAWDQVMPLELTDEWMAAVLNANPVWFQKLRLWIPRPWLRRWMPDKVLDDGETIELVEEETLGEDLSE